MSHTLQKKNNSGKRCPHVIIYNILLAVRENKYNPITYIMYSSKVDTRTFYKYKDMLVREGFVGVKEIGRSETLTITDKGLRYIQLFKELESM